MRFLVVLCGPTGSGKTVIGKHVADERGFQFLDGDDQYTYYEKIKLVGDDTLTEEEYNLWISKAARACIPSINVHRVTILSCSALTKEHRDTIRAIIANTDRGLRSKITIRFVCMSMAEEKAKAIIEDITTHVQGADLTLVPQQRSGVQVQKQFAMWENPLLTGEQCFFLDCNSDLDKVKKNSVKLVKSIVRRPGVVGCIKDAWDQIWLSWCGGGAELNKWRGY